MLESPEFLRVLECNQSIKMFHSVQERLIYSYLLYSFDLTKCWEIGRI